MKRLWKSMWWAVAVLVAACSGNELGTTPENPVAIGQDDFVTAERDHGDIRAVGADAEAPGASLGGNAPSGREGTVEEADIYRIDANRLFYLNTYRGFMIYDLGDPNNPQRISRLPIHGYPIEMFVTSTTVYALLRDALYVTQDAGGVRFKRHNVSQLVAIDITDLSNPRVLKTVDIVGDLKEGVSRKIDDTIYVVSHLPRSYYYRGYPYSSERTEQAWVYSFNVADRQNPTLVARLKIFEEGGPQQSSGGTSSSRWFSGVAISATANTLHVVENWYTYEYVNGGPHDCGTFRSMQEAVVSIIDISDPTGLIRLHSRFSTYGALNDQFKHTYVHEPATGKAYYLGIFARQEWSRTNCSGEMFVQNALEAWDVTNGANPVRVKTLVFGKPNETVRGSAFDVTRKVVYAITARQIDPLYAISFADPADLKVLSAIDGLSGDMNVFRLVGGGNFLIGIGRDNSGACTGFAEPSFSPTNVAVSVIDVADLGAIRLVQRKCVALDNASWISSDINWNLDQAHKMIGMHSDERASIVSVPVSYYVKVNAEDEWWWSRPESAVGLMSFDLSAYDPSKDHLNQTVLKNHGTVVHPAGHVRRSIVFTHQGATPRRMMVNLSDTHVSVVDIDDLNAPARRSVVEVAPHHQRLFRFGDYIVDEVRQGESYYGWYGGPPAASEFRVKLAAAGLDDARPVATFSVSRVQQVVQFKSLLVIFRQATAPATREEPEFEAVVYDLSNPATPVRKAAVRVPTPMPPSVWYGCGAAWGYWPYTYANWAASDRGLGLLTFRYIDGNVEQRLVFLELSNPSAPRVTNRLLATRTWDIFGRGMVGREYLSLVGDGQNLIANFKEQVGTFTSDDGTKFARFRYSVEHYRGADLRSEASVSIPGRLIRSWEKDGERHYLTTDEHFAPRERSGARQWVPEARLHLLKRAGAAAVLLDSLTMDTLQLGDMVGDADRLFLTLRSSYGYWVLAAEGSGTSSEMMGGDTLTVIDLRQGRLNRTFSAPVGTYDSQLMGVSENRLFVNLRGDGVLAVDVSDLSAPVGQHFTRTLGYATHIAFTGDLAFIAAGNFGIFEMDLSAPASILRL